MVLRRLIMPDGYSVDLDQFHGLDQIGEEGLKDKVNNHYFRSSAPRSLWAWSLERVRLRREAALDKLHHSDIVTQAVERFAQDCGSPARVEIIDHFRSR
jgi:type IV secretory pathway VirB10-like protein